MELKQQQKLEGKQKGIHLGIGSRRIRKYFRSHVEPLSYTGDG